MTRRRRGKSVIDRPSAAGYPSWRPVTVVETAVFRRFAEGLIGEEEVAALIDFLAYRPEAGDVIEGTGGIRKLRWRIPGKGKRGGARVIYYYHSLAVPLLLLTIYGKSDRADMSPDEKRRMVRLTSEFVAIKLRRN